MQVVGYEAVPDPALLLAADGEVTRLALGPGTELDYSLGERHCAGTVQNGHHDACPNAGAPGAAPAVAATPIGAAATTTTATKSADTVLIDSPLQPYRHIHPSSLRQFCPD